MDLLFASDVKYSVTPIQNTLNYGGRPSTVLERRVGIDTSLDGLLLPSRMKAYAEMQVATQELAGIEKLENGWDGTNSLAPSKAAVGFARKAITLMSTMEQHLVGGLDIAPNSNGTISLEWETELGSAYIEFGASRYVFILDQENQNSILREGFATDFFDIYLTAISHALYPERLYLGEKVFGKNVVGNFKYHLEV
jgi:hypothetical protein